MPQKYDSDSTASQKIIKLFRLLIADGRKHYQSDLAKYLNCSPQTVIRLIEVIERELGTSFETGFDGKRKWYCIETNKKLLVKNDVLRYASICRDLAKPILPKQISDKLDESLFNLFLAYSDESFCDKTRLMNSSFTFFNKGYIDYSSKFELIDNLLSAIENKNICNIYYKAAGKNDLKKHRFVATKFATMNNTLYVLGADLTKNNSERFLSYYAIHRIEKIIFTDEYYEDEITTVDLASFGFPWNPPTRYRIYFKPGRSADYVRERIWAKEQKIIEQEDGGIILEIVTCSDPELMSWYRSFGDSAKLLDD